MKYIVELVPLRRAISNAIDNVFPPPTRISEIVYQSIMSEIEDFLDDDCERVEK